MPEKGFILPLSLLLPERKLLHSFPKAYNPEISPYNHQIDFSTSIRAELAKKRKFKVRTSKVIFVGDVAVGKTNIVSRFCYDKFQGNHKATIGVDFEIEHFNILGQNFVLEMWDTAGQERFKCIAQAYYRKASVIVVVFDMSNQETLQSTTAWLKSALTVNSIQKPLIFLVGTKSDLLSHDEFIRIEKLAGDVAKGIKAEYWSVSARTGFKIVEFFQRIAALAFETAMKEAIVEKDYIDLMIAAQMQKKSNAFGKFQQYNNKRIVDLAVHVDAWPRGPHDFSNFGFSAVFWQPCLQAAFQLCKIAVQCCSTLVHIRDGRVSGFWFFVTRTRPIQSEVFGRENLISGRIGSCFDNVLRVGFVRV